MLKKSTLQRVINRSNKLEVKDHGEFFFPFNLYSTGEWRVYRKVRRQCGGMTYMILSAVDSNTDPCSKDSCFAVYRPPASPGEL